MMDRSSTSSQHENDDDREEESPKKLRASPGGEPDGEEALGLHALGLSLTDAPVCTAPTLMECQDKAYEVVPNPDADEVDLSELRGTKAPITASERMLEMQDDGNNDDDLDALAELVPSLKSRAADNQGMTMGGESLDPQVSQEKLPAAAEEPRAAGQEVQLGKEVELDADSSDDNDEQQEPVKPPEVKEPAKEVQKASVVTLASSSSRNDPQSSSAENLQKIDSMQVEQNETEDVEAVPEAEKPPPQNLSEAVALEDGGNSLRGATSISEAAEDTPAAQFASEEQNLGGFDDGDSDEALESDDGDQFTDSPSGAKKAPPFASSGASLSTATMTQEVRMPMYLPTFKPATGCTNASDFIVRCFVARLRSGITVVKHGRSRWCKSRLRILHIHPDGRSLSWKPAIGEPTSSKKPPKLDLSTCTEVRHAWSPDPLNPMYTGTAILRQKCEAANAHKSFALIFAKRTVDITAVTADQCKVLMEGFSALCFRLQVANLAGRGKKSARDEEEVATTASATLTNNSQQMSPSGSGSAKTKKKSSVHR